MKLKPSSLGEVIIKADPRRAGAGLVMGIMAIPPRGAIPLHRLLSQDEVVFVYKGQGRATIDGRSQTVVPGTVLSIPRQLWYGLQNTGTGLLQIAWMVAPPGIEEFFRELSRLGEGAGAQALAEVARRHQIELAPEGAPAVAAPPEGQGRHRRRRGGRGRHSPRAAQTTPAAQAASPSPAVRPSAPARAVPASKTPDSGAGPRRRRRRHRGGRGRGAASLQPLASPPTAAASSGRRQAQGRHRRGRVKEVYMGGRWVQVSGEGPVIHPGAERPWKKRPGETDSDTPRGPLSVPL